MRLRRAAVAAALLALVSSIPASAYWQSRAQVSVAVTPLSVDGAATVNKGSGGSFTINITTSGANGTISTTNPNTILLGWYGSGTAAMTPGSGWTAFTTPAQFGLFEYRIVSAAQSNTTILATTGSGPIWYGDAITQ